MAKLTGSQRRNLPRGDFAEPKQRKYPINDRSHARNALARVSQYGSPKQKAMVRSAVRKRYPGIRQSR